MATFVNIEGVWINPEYVRDVRPGIAERVAVLDGATLMAPTSRVTFADGRERSFLTRPAELVGALVRGYVSHEESERVHQEIKRVRQEIAEGRRVAGGYVTRDQAERVRQLAEGDGS